MDKNLFYPQLSKVSRRWLTGRITPAGGDWVRGSPTFSLRRVPVGSLVDASRISPAPRPQRGDTNFGVEDLDSVLL
jgi:hypothetical protein